MRALVLAFVALLALPAALGQAPAAHETDLVLLVYHPSPDPRAGEPDADAFSSPDAPDPLGLARVGDVLLLPATRFDGIARASDAPEGRPESALAQFREMQRLLLLRQRTGASVALTLDARVANGTLVAEVDARALPGAPERVDVALYLLEDFVPDAATGARHRFLARADLGVETLALAQATGISRSFRLSPDWDASNLAVVAVARATEADARREEGEAMNAAIWRAGQHGPTVQERKAVLVEHASATWCAPCAPSDEALALLASSFGVDTAREPSYARAPGALALAGACGGLAVAFALLRRRAA